MKPGVSRVTTTVLVGSMALLMGGCLERSLKPLNPCLVSGVVAEIAVTNIDKVDLLFMVDNSGSMREEQVALRTQFPNMVRVLTTGDRDGDGITEFPPAKDLHLAVVSSDMGLVGIQGIPGCDGLGDDGIMQNTGDPAAGCQANYPRFLAFDQETGNAQQTATDFGCIAGLGTEGCGFEQQLEATLKAVWPATDRGGNGAMDGMGVINEPNRIIFLGDPSTGFGTTGHGDGMNAGFLRNDPTIGLSLIAVILVTDEEDCSAANTRHFTPNIYLDPADPLTMQDLNLRCFNNKQNLYSIDRYVNGLKALRPDAEQLVIFGGIVGVPPDLVSKEARDLVNFQNEPERNQYYANMLADTRMQEVPDPNRTPEQGGNLTPSCVTDTGRAFPPRRIVEVAQQFGENGIIQSICQSDFTDAMDAIIEVIARQLGAVCLPRELIRDSDGKVGCDVVWELPLPGQAPAATPTTCADPRYQYLNTPTEGITSSAKGGEICTVTQLSVMNRTKPQGMGDGWFYDDFSDEVMVECNATAPQRIAFTDAAKPPTGVTVKLECLNETQSLTSTRTDIATGQQVYQPSIGSSCKDVEWPPGSGTILDSASACAVTLNTGAKEMVMFCHPQTNTCVQPCTSASDCPASWTCDDRPETIAGTVPPGVMSNGTPICTNPTCGE